MSEYSFKFWSLTFDMFKKDIHKLEDNLIILLHWLMLKNDFQMLGLVNEGNESKIDENEKATDNLPPYWSQDLTYKFRYVRNQQLFILNGIKIGSIFIFNFHNVKTKKVSSSSFGDITVIVQIINDMVHNNDDKKKFKEAVDLLEKELIEPMLLDIESKRVASTQTISLPSNLPSTNTVYQSDFINRQAAGVRNGISEAYGLLDLDPLGMPISDNRGGGGGMLFDPLRRPLRPRAVLPTRNPWARFDPINPDIRDDSRNPDIRSPFPDHMRPPNFDDDMYM